MKNKFFTKTNLEALFFQLISLPRNFIKLFSSITFLLYKKSAMK